MISASNICKVVGQNQAQILTDGDATIEDGEFVSISGRSGSGKSTLLYILSTLDHPSSGTLTIDGEEPIAWDEHTMHEFRNHKVGFVFQFHYLIPELTALENVLMPPRRHHKQALFEEKALDLLDQFSIANKADHLPSEMSGGEQQRVAIARALIMDPKYIFADEPTGNLDSSNGDRVMEILQQANSKNGATLVLVTHEPDYAKLATREILLMDGRLVGSDPRMTPSGPKS